MVTTAPTAHKAMVWLAGGRLLMGDDRYFPEERPVVAREVAGFWVDVHPVTNAAFRRFVAGTGHVTIAEKAPLRSDFPDARDEDLVAGSLVFTPTAGPVPLDDWTRWWRWVPGADWRHPQGPGTTLHGMETHPVVHVGFEDALAYAAWAGKALPTEEQWEFAARGGLEGAAFPWGDDFMPRGRVMANTWHGRFPWENLSPNGYAGTSPVRRFPANGYGLYDVAGNVWEWTADPWTDDHAGSGVQHAGHACCSPSVRLEEEDRRVTKGGSHLCAPSYCLRYRPAARQGHGVRSTTSHVGFRCVAAPA